jgi:hypothetical protein
MWHKIRFDGKFWKLVFIVNAHPRACGASACLRHANLQQDQPTTGILAVHLVFDEWRLVWIEQAKQTCLEHGFRFRQRGGSYHCRVLLRGSRRQGTQNIRAIPGGPGTSHMPAWCTLYSTSSLPSDHGCWSLHRFFFCFCLYIFVWFFWYKRMVIIEGAENSRGCARGSDETRIEIELITS